jgi:glycosyltransferase involved in cell wall biosynthesis
MRVLHVIPSLEKGGAERYCADVCAELTQRPGVEVMLLSMSAGNTYSFITNHLNYKVCNSKVFPSISGKSVMEIQEYEQILAEFKPDIVHSHLFWAELLTRAVLNDKIAYVTHCQNNMPEFKNFEPAALFQKSTWTKQFEKRWITKRYRKCKNNFIVISKDTEAYYKKVLPKDVQRITLMYHAIDFPKFTKENNNRQPGLTEVRLIYVARFAVYKNHRFLVEIVKELKDRGCPVKLDFLGNGELMESVKELVNKYQLQDEINFAGVVDDVGAYLNKANIYVHPAYYEPFGLVIIEAMAAGLPVICLDGKGNRDLIEQGKNGYMFYQQDPKLFADNIVEVLSDPKRYQQLSDYAVQYASKFDMKLHVDNLLKYYKSILLKSI